MLERSLLLGLALAASHIHAMPTLESKDEIIAAGPTCIQTRSPGGYSASDISSLITEDGTIGKACDIAKRSVTTLDEGLVSLISYGLNAAYFFNMSHISREVNVEAESPSACSDTFSSIFSACVKSQNFWGGWVSHDATNYSSKWLAFPAWLVPS